MGGAEEPKNRHLSNRPSRRKTASDSPRLIYQPQTLMRTTTAFAMDHYGRCIIIFQALFATMRQSLKRT